MVEDLTSGDEFEEFRDTYVNDAKTALRELLRNSAEVFYLKQLEVRFEKVYFHWVTARAVRELIEEGFLGFTDEVLRGNTRVRFLFRRGYRYFRLQVRRMLEVVRAYSDPEIAIASGLQAELLFLAALAERGFVIAGRNTNEFRGKKWERTDHDLDFIIERDGVAYGCEVKNTWDYIEHDELVTKMDMCDYLGIVSFFIMRYAPKSYLDEIWRRGGVFLLFESHVYPLGHRALVQRIRETLALPVDSPRSIPSGIIDRFMNRVHGPRLHDGR